MKFLVYGSMNIDRVYTLPRLPEKGETLSCEKFEIHVGGKGLNQAVSLSKSGAQVYMAGSVGRDGVFLTDYLGKVAVDTYLIRVTDGFTGHAVIEVDPDGQNQMVLFPGANKEITPDYCDTVLERFEAGDLVLMQYETSQVEYMIEKSHLKGLKIALNPSPFVEKLKTFDYGNVDYLILNESEGQGITGEKDLNAVIKKLKERLRGGAVILTQGVNGAIYAKGESFVHVPAFKVSAVDTTGAGDTFTGYCLTALIDGCDAKTALTRANAASALAVMKSGAAETIPENESVIDFLSKNSHK